MARLLLVLALTLLTLHSGQAPHLHRGATPGTYNEEHVLASLDSAIGDVPLPDQAPALSVAIATQRPTPAPDRTVASAFARHAASRAPPLA